MRMDYTYAIRWSAQERQWVGVCLELPSLRHLADRPGSALDGIFSLVDMTVDDMKQRGETPPIPGCYERAPLPSSRRPVEGS